MTIANEYVEKKTYVNIDYQDMCSQCYYLRMGKKNKKIDPMKQPETRVSLVNNTWPLGHGVQVNGDDVEEAFE